MTDWNRNGGSVCSYATPDASMVNGQVDVKLPQRHLSLGTPMTLDSAGTPANGDLTYVYRPSLLGAPWMFTLTDRGIDWSAGVRLGHIRYRDVRRLRLSFKPGTIQAYRFLTEIWAEGAPKLEILSSSWKSMVEQERLDDAYAAFITELHARVAATGSPVPVRYEQGANPFLYWPGLVFYTVVALGLAATVVRALQLDTWGAAAFIGGIGALFLWQGGNFFRRNRPGIYRPDDLPRAVVPRV